jgi:hypothetical protein
MNFMDWEKQDNEIRKLIQESDDFLPDTEAWDQTESWNNLKQKMKPQRNMIAFSIMRYAAAACFIVAISYFGFKYISNDGSRQIVVERNNSVANPAEINKHPLEEIDIERKESVLELVDSYTKNKVENSILSIQKDGKAIDNNGGYEKIESVPKEVHPIVVTNDVLLPEVIREMNADKLLTAGLTENELNKQMEEVQVAVSTAKPRMRVVHYNHLNQSNSITPPGFAKGSKTDEQLSAVAMQNKAVTFRNENPLQIRIELTPQIKKSL